MKRDPLGKFFLLALLVVVAGLAAITRKPDSPWVEKVTRAAVIGPWIERFADLYRQPPAAEPPSQAASAEEARIGVAADLGSQANADAASSRRVVEGRTDPGVGAEGSDETGVLADGGDQQWIALPPSGRPPPMGSQAALTLPIPSRAADPEVLATAVDLLADPGPSRRLGPYALHTDVTDRGLLIYLSAIAAQLESVYTDRYGRAPLPGVREEVVLFASRGSYLRFLEGQPDALRTSVLGMVRSGVVTTYAEGRARREIAATLIHELAHLLNKRALGPALPPWLDEGIADDLAQSQIVGLRIVPGSLGGTTVQRGRRIEYKGAHVAVIELQRAMSRGELAKLPTLVEFDWAEFQRLEGRSERYGHSSFFVRSLLDSHDLALAAAFRAFLQDVSEGRKISGEALLSRLGRSWEDLDSGLVTFVERQAVEAGLPTSRARDSSSRQASEPSS